MRQKARVAGLVQDLAGDMLAWWRRQDLIARGAISALGSLVLVIAASLVFGWWPAGFFVAGGCLLGIAYLLLT